MLPDFPAAFWPCAVVAVVAVGIAKAGFGGGVGVIATPLMALAIPVTDAAALMLPLLMVCDVFAVRHYRSQFHRPSIAVLLPGALLGIGVGAFFFGYFHGHQRALQIGLGTLSLLFVVFQIGRAVILGALSKRHPGPAEGVLMGAVAGFTSTLAHAGGPPVSIYLLPQQLPRQLFVGTTVIAFAAINWFKVGPYWALGLWRLEHVPVLLILAPLSWMGVRLGLYLNRRFTDLWFNRVVYTVLFLTGLQLVLGHSLLGILAH
ncbi:MAG: TSUP family transporter [Candidatus Latescibacteria bacterium]|nr:TSUP family transporter [Candidatus Latescibacterota bacterium]